MPTSHCTYSWLLYKFYLLPVDILFVVVFNPSSHPAPTLLSVCQSFPMFATLA